MFTCIDNVTSVETQFNQPKLRNLLSSSKIVKKTIKLSKKFILHKIDKNIKRHNLCILGNDDTCVKTKNLGTL